MIAFYFSATGKIHQTIPGFGAVTESNGEFWVDGWNTTTKSVGMEYRYIAEGTEIDPELSIDSYPAVTKPLSESDRLASIEMAMLELAEAML